MANSFFILAYYYEMPMNLIEAIQSENMDELIDRMNAYAISRLKSVGVKSFNGKEPIDFVGDVILKVMENTRDWSKAQCSFREFLFGCLKSEISNFFKNKELNFLDDLPEIADTYLSDDKIEDKKNKIYALLKQEGADDTELIVFGYWMEGVKKPSEIAGDLGINIKEVYNSTKRIERRLFKIQSIIKTIV